MVQCRVRLVNWGCVQGCRQIKASLDLLAVLIGRSFKLVCDFS